MCPPWCWIIPANSRICYQRETLAIAETEALFGVNRQKLTKTGICAQCVHTRMHPGNFQGAAVGIIQIKPTVPKLSVEAWFPMEMKLAIKKCANTCVSSRCLSVLLIKISGDRGEDCILSCQFVNEYFITDIFVSDDRWSVIDHLACYDCLYFLRLVLFTNVCLALSVLWVLARGNGVVVNTQSQSIGNAKVPGEYKILFEH